MQRRLVPVVILNPTNPVKSFRTSPGCVATTKGRVTMTLNVQELVVLSESDAWQVTGVEPSGNRLPEAGEQVTIGFKSQSSVAVTVKGTFTPLPFVIHMEMSDGHAI